MKSRKLSTGLDNFYGLSVVVSNADAIIKNYVVAANMKTIRL